jgi:predicted RNA-binding Zn-ribbon protein involved in translation (DUF1610 family)
MNLQINMICKKCDDVLPVRVKLDDEFEMNTPKKLNIKEHNHNLFEQVPCPQCGQQNIWDRVNRNFISS